MARTTIATVRAQREAFKRLKSELGLAFAAPEESYIPLTAAEVIARNRPGFDKGQALGSDVNPA